MSSVHEILEAIRALPRPERMRLVEQIAGELDEERSQKADLEPAPGSLLELRNGFYVYTGPVDPALDHRVTREERVDDLVRLASAGRR